MAGGFVDVVARAIVYNKDRKWSCYCLSAIQDILYHSVYNSFRIMKGQYDSQGRCQFIASWDHMDTC